MQYLSWIMAYCMWAAVAATVLTAVKLSRVFFVLLPPLVGLAVLWTASALGYSP